jgi:arylsulfatase
MEGISLAPLFAPGQTLSRPKALFWEHEGHKAVRNGKWKLVSSFNDPWELHDMENDRTELRDLRSAQPQVEGEMIALYESWARRVGVKPWPLPAAGAAAVKTSGAAAPQGK